MTTTSSTARGPHPQWQRAWHGTIKRGDLNSIHRERGGLVSWTWAQISTFAAPEFRQRCTRVFPVSGSAHTGVNQKISQKSRSASAHTGVNQKISQKSRLPRPGWPGPSFQAPLSSPPSASRLGAPPFLCFFGVGKSGSVPLKAPIVNRPFWGPA